jgi:hypothetical protein
MTKPAYEQIAEFIRGSHTFCVVKAPPGSGKSFHLLASLQKALDEGRRIAIAAQTNNQVNDLCIRFGTQYPSHKLFRFSSKTFNTPSNFPDNVRVISLKGDIPAGPCTIVATCSKLGLTTLTEPFEILLIDEAWQMTWATFLTLRTTAPRFVLIGDPGQIPPTVTVDCERWETSTTAPHYPAPQIILGVNGLDGQITKLELDQCWRLPHDSVTVVQMFYDFDFGAVARPGERFIRATKSGRGSPSDNAIDLLKDHSTVILTYPTEETGAPIETDQELASFIAELASRLLARQCLISTDGSEVSSPRRLKVDDIGIVSTHNQMNTAIASALSGATKGIDVTTPERWQGLERPVMIAVHPLSGVSVPSSFNLETGRLCVMASRHRSACIFVTRDHVGHTLATRLPSGDHALGAEDTSGKGHAQHTSFWRYHKERGLII